jgi:hypothetical protein
MIALCSMRCEGIAPIARYVLVLLSLGPWAILFAHRICVTSIRSYACDASRRLIDFDLFFKKAPNDAGTGKVRRVLPS